MEEEVYDAELANTSRDTNILNGLAAATVAVAIVVAVAANVTADVAAYAAVGFAVAAAAADDGVAVGDVVNAVGVGNAGVDSHADDAKWRRWHQQR